MTVPQGSSTVVKPRVAAPIKSCQERLDIVHGPDACGPTPFATAGFGPGSLPTITTPITGPFPSIFSPGTAAHGVDLSVQFVNDSACRVQLFSIINAGQVYGFLEPGAQVEVGYGIVTDGVNQPPIPVPGPTFNSQQLVDNQTASTMNFVAQGFYGNSLTGAVGIFGSPAVTLEPGDFLWFSAQTYVATTGPWTGTGRVFFGGFGSGIILNAFGLPI